MHNQQFIQYVNLPLIPNKLLSSIDLTKIKSQFNYNPTATFDNYVWADKYNEDINQWCKENISPDVYFAFQIMSGDLPAHQDKGTLTKFNYIITTGGENVITNFYDDNQRIIVASYNVLPHRWHILKADAYHSVSNIEPGQLRLSITGRIF